VIAAALLAPVQLSAKGGRLSCANDADNASTVVQNTSIKTCGSHRRWDPVTQKCYGPGDF
jgi:hypothetical protein